MLLGTWKGRGAGEYPTIEPFAYLEEVTFAHVGKPFLTYAQKTKDADSGQPLHAEVGYLRCSGAGEIEFIVVQPSGITETHYGSAISTGQGMSLDLRLDRVALTRTAKEVSDVVRRIEVVDGRLHYTVAMAAVGEPLTHHLQADLALVED